ncbi:MAG: HEAT repeat domain-containing protein, partial [Verrucomicrobiota bacterium]
TQDDDEAAEAGLAEGKAGGGVCRTAYLAAGASGEVGVGAVCKIEPDFVSTMRRGIITTLAILIFFGALLIGESVWYRLNLGHREQVLANMATLRDRAKSHPPDTNALNSLINSTQSKDQWESTKAIVYIGQIGSNAEPAVEILLKALNGSDPYSRREAAGSLGEIGPVARRAIPDLIKAVENYPDADVGWFAARSLGEIGSTNDAQLLKALAQATNSPYELMRANADLGLKALYRRQEMPKQ